MVDFKDYTYKMDRTLEVLQEDFGAVRAGRANARVLLRRARDRHVHHVGDVTDGFRALFPARLEDAHDLKQIGGHGRDLPVELPVGFFFRNELAPCGREAFPLLQFFF